MTDSEKRDAEDAKLAPMLKDLLSRVHTPLYLDLMYAVAMERAAKYRAHLKAGFTEAQSLELCAK